MTLQKIGCITATATLIVALSMAQPVSAANWTISANICIEQIVDFRPKPIPVGCEIVDCCEGCPGPPFDLDWRIRFESVGIEAMVLEFENLDPAVAQELQIEGPGEWISENELKLGQGETLISGFPGEQEGMPAVAFAHAIPGESGFFKKAAAEGDGFLDFSVEQGLGGVPVNEFQQVYTLVICPPPTLPGPPPIDRIDLSPNTSDQAVILADGRDAFSQCFDDQVFRTATDVAVGNFVTPWTCHEELTVFSDDNEMRLIENPRWTNPSGDFERVDMHDRLLPEVTLWLVNGPWFDTSVRATTDIQRADQLYNVSNCGIGFDWRTDNQTANPQAQNLLDSTCADVADLQAQIGFDVDRLNVYYLRNVGARGWYCGNNTILIGSNADNESLAHELGHALSLEHTNRTVGFPTTNLMVTGGVGRDSISEGQCFRANVNECPAGRTSFLNSSGLRASLPGRQPLPTRCCPHNATSDACPAVSLDILPN